MSIAWVSGQAVPRRPDVPPWHESFGSPASSESPVALRPALADGLPFREARTSCCPSCIGTAAGSFTRVDNRPSAAAILLRRRGVAQPGSARALGARGPGFESRRPDRRLYWSKAGSRRRDTRRGIALMETPVETLPCDFVLPRPAVLRGRPPVGRPWPASLTSASAEAGGGVKTSASALSAASSAGVVLTPSTGGTVATRRPLSCHARDEIVDAGRRPGGWHGVEFCGAQPGLGALGRVSADGRGEAQDVEGVCELLRVLGNRVAVGS